MKTEIVAIIISTVAILLTLYSLWLTYFQKKRLKLYCSSFTALGFGQDQDNPSRIALGTRTRVDERIVTAFATKIIVTNRGAIPRLVQDIIIKANYVDESKEFVYDPIFFWNFTDQNKSGGEQVVGQSQKGQFDLPFLVPPKSTTTFEHHVLFMPIDKVTMIEKDLEKDIQIKVFSLEKGEKNYRIIAQQLFTKKDLIDLDNTKFCGVVSDDSKIYRNKIIS